MLAWIGQTLVQAQAQGLTRATRVAQDGTLVAANASRHHLLNQERLEQRLAQLDAALQPLPAEAPAESNPAAPNPPRWLAPTPGGRQAQRRRYLQARDQLEELLRANAQRNPRERRPARQVVVSVSDPAALPGRDKEKVFRPLYNVQLVCDVDSPLILGYEVSNRSSDASALEPLLEQVTHLVGHQPIHWLADTTYVTGANLARCAQAGVTLDGPWAEHAPPKQTAKYFDKKQFTWLPQENAYRCPQGQPLTPIGKEWRRHADGRREWQYRYRCAGSICRACPLQACCAVNPGRGRSLRRSEYEDLIEAHQHRMNTPEAKALYKLRRQTVELGYADFKEHRHLRRFWGRGQPRASAQVGFAVLAHNLLALRRIPAPSTNPAPVAGNASKTGP